jgi:RNA polymerase sigma-70 factor (ECF subfamily)
LGKEKSLEELAHTHYDRLFRAALFMCGDADVAEDLVQDTFLAAAGALDSFEGRSSYYTWLYGILLNKFRGWLRRKGGPLSLQELAANSAEEGGNAAELVRDERPDAPQKMMRRERAEMVREAIDELPAHHRSVVVLRYLEGLSYQEIADALDCSLGTVKSRLHYALRKVGGKLKRRPEMIE